MLLKINSLDAHTRSATIAFEMPETFAEGDQRRRDLKAELRREAENSDRVHEIRAHLRCLKIWARDVSRIEEAGREEDCYDFDDAEYDLGQLLQYVMHAIRIRSGANFRDTREYLAENPVENLLLNTASEWIRDQIVCDLADNVPEEIRRFVIPDRVPEKPPIDKAEILKYVKGRPPRYAVNIIRHRFTSYDRDRFLEPYLRAFVRANMWIAENFPTLADEAIAQVDEKMAGHGKRA
jgi:hypothetical protein